MPVDKIIEWIREQMTYLSPDGSPSKQPIFLTRDEADELLDWYDEMTLDCRDIN